MYIYIYTHICIYIYTYMYIYIYIYMYIIYIYIYILYYSLFLFITIVSQNVSSVVLDWNDITYIPYSVSFFVSSILWSLTLALRPESYGCEARFVASCNAWSWDRQNSSRNGVSRSCRRTSRRGKTRQFSADVEDFSAEVMHEISLMLFLAVDIGKDWGWYEVFWDSKGFFGVLNLGIAWHRKTRFRRRMIPSVPTFTCDLAPYASVCDHRHTEEMLHQC